MFAGLCRQQGLDVVMLTPSPAGGTDGKSTTKSASAKYWLAAVLSEGQLYLFDVRLGLPIPGPDGKGIATLEQVRKDDSLLRQLDLENEKYPLTSTALKNVDIDLVAEPFSLSRRASQMETNLSGDNRMILAVTPSKLADRLKQISGVTTVRLWGFPFQTLQGQLKIGKSAREDEALAFEPFAMRPGLWRGRVLHFQGRHQDALGETLNRKEKKSSEGYLSRSVRPTDKAIAAATNDDERRVEITAKRDAAYWVGLMALDDGKYAVAATWLSRPALTAADSPWLFGANYNLARALEGLGKVEEAIALLEHDTSPQQHGNKLRARRLRSQLKLAKQSE